MLQKCWLTIELFIPIELVLHKASIKKEYETFKIPKRQSEQGLMLSKALNQQML